MADPGIRPGIPDRLRVFISATIGECAAEREAARRAIVGLNFESVQFEREGARAEAPREFYLRKLQDSHIVVGIFRESYGWIDQAKGMTISGLEDEFREAERQGKDFLGYVLKTPSAREPKLTTLVDELMAGPHVVYLFNDGEDLEQRIRDDLTALVTDRVTAAQANTSSTGSAAMLLDAIFAGGALRIRRSGLLDGLGRAMTMSRTAWIIGQAGAGKTALAAEWASERGAAYVNARGLDPRQAVLAIARALGVATGAELAIPLFDDARSLLVSRWRDGTGWPLVVDDPDDPASVWPVIEECLAGNATGSAVFVSREPPGNFPGHRFEVPGFSDDEIAALRAIAGANALQTMAGELPLSLRRTQSALSVADRFAALDPVSREALGYLALTPAALGIDDLLALLGESAGSPVALSELMASAGDLVMDSHSSYSFVHDLLREELAALVAARPQLHGLLIDRLVRYLDSTGRAWAAFRLVRDDMSPAAERLANRAVREAVFSGATRYMVEALEFLATYYRSHGERGPLVSVLMGLADARISAGRMIDAPALLDEALAIARDINDRETEGQIEILQAVIELRRSSSEAALVRVRDLQRQAADDGRIDDQARLLADEGVAFLGFNEVETAMPLFREARRLFETIDDQYGVEIATRNLIVCLAMTDDGIAESDRLRASLAAGEADSPRYRAWLCNLLVPRLRREGRYDEAEALALEAIAIAIDLGDQYLVAINTMVLGNVLREAGDLDGARAAYAEAGRLAQLVGRPDIEGRSSRLMALTDNGAAEAATGSERRALAERAEQFATHAMGLLADSFAWGEHALAVEERGDARRYQERHAAAREDYADAVRDYLKAGDEPEAVRLLHYYLRYIHGEPDETIYMARAFAGTARAGDPESSWVDALVATLDACPRAAAPVAMGNLIRTFIPQAHGERWFDCLSRCLLLVQQREARGERTRLHAMLLLAILGFSTHRQLREIDLFTLAGLWIGRSRTITIRHRPGDDVNFIVRPGHGDHMLFTIRTAANRPETLFVALVLAAFLDAFGEELATIITPDLFANGVALDVVVFGEAGETGGIRDLFSGALADKPVATARMTPEEGDEPPVVLIVRADALEALVAHPNRGGELEIMLARFLDEVIYATIGRGVDDQIFSAKVRELLMSVFG